MFELPAKKEPRLQWLDVGALAAEVNVFPGIVVPFPPNGKSPL
ncbi:hypothetical protein RFM26_14270 [Mesorhizobium sp. VK23B]|uniref:Uncharacterized protein n=1 Tax=Mesorhizobium dulcispinae TaxID=3072316 RepID=A0ABU4XG33_9HYPH|nr:MULTISPECIES: hypothetical protein [unclassified Mesorhizobium]MDX8466855.1 hypothetical protein [Mesorhizobium sp. VK23B]MDX8473478.1 hypothetical protein [Mesorhizobium sp. VK23A]